MRATPLHPHCYCIYTPYYKKVKGKRKKWKTAVKETMSKFSEKKQIEILRSREKLMRFKNGEDIEKIFNAIRPKYPIKKYVDILEGKGYNSFMRKATKEELEEFLEIDKKIFDIVKNLNEETFKDLWVSEREYKKHIKKRLNEKVIENENDYIEKIKECVTNPDEIYLKKYSPEIKEQFNRWNRIYYKKNNLWVSIFNEKGKINTAYFISKDFNEILFKGNKSHFDILIVSVKELKNAREN